jgi:hypothetical protein
MIWKDEVSGFWLEMRCRKLYEEKVPRCARWAGSSTPDEDDISDAGDSIHYSARSIVRWINCQSVVFKFVLGRASVG